MPWDWIELTHKASVNGYTKRLLSSGTQITAINVQYGGAPLPDEDYWVTAYYRFEGEQEEHEAKAKLEFKGGSSVENLHISHSKPIVISKVGVSIEVP